MTSRPSYPASRLEYALPPELIAQQPLAQRTDSRLLHLAAGALHDRQFRELPALLPESTLIVLNDSRVLPARLLGRRASGGVVEVLFLRWLGEDGLGRDDESGLCEALVGSNAKLGAGELIELPNGWSAELLEPKSLGGTRVRYRYPGGHPAELPILLGYLRANGSMPLPPYIKRDAVGAHGSAPGAEVEEDRAHIPAPLREAGGPTQGRPLQDDKERYQTVYADAAKEGSSAAPTAGLHFDQAMLARLEAEGHRIARVTLHVGLGTFQPLKVEDLAEHEMHEEAFSVQTEVAREYLQALDSGRPVLAVGTTSLRVLHTILGLSREYPDFRASLEEPGTCSGMTRAFIYPGQDTDAATHLLTNFHLPKSTLLALVYSFGGEELLRAAYAHAIEQRYRFFSYGDCMLISRGGI
ncbi:S-adenosylmethionine:tRNA ribosyltransferase-isomerase [bacterium]|nr:S-adenosylmethionine:tRNA ribosyltransferase-isomerase [bacterium]